MKAILYFIVTYTTVLRTTSFINTKHGESSSIYRSGKIGHNDKDYRKNERFISSDLKNKNEIEDSTDLKAAKEKVEVFKRLKYYEKEFNKLENLAGIVEDPEKKQQFRKDPVLNSLRRRRVSDSDITETSSSMEVDNWKDEWKQHWLKKKLEAINSSMPKGDMVNMVAARPWGVPCGDPNQHDLPWGSCMLPMECEAEYRIYRGDYFCGRTQFICCALQVTNYDLYAGFDVSFDDSSLATDSEEKRNRDRGTKENKRRKRIRDRKRRLQDRFKRKKKIKRTIKKIMRQIRKILNRSFRNGTTARKKKTKQLKKFIKEMKKRFIKERKSVKDIHEIELIKIDAALQKRLNEISGMNQEYVKNQTFRDVIVNGTINRQNAKMLVEAYPELAEMFAAMRRSGSGGGMELEKKRKRPRDYLEYDVEYGYLYY